MTLHLLGKKCRCCNKTRRLFARCRCTRRMCWDCVEQCKYCYDEDDVPIMPISHYVYTSIHGIQP